MIVFADGTKINTSSVLHSQATGILRIRTDAPIAEVAAVFSNPAKVSQIQTDTGETYIGFSLQAIIPEFNCIRVNLTRGGFINAG